MKRYNRRFLSLAVVCTLALALLTGCAGRSYETAWNLSGVEPVYITEWPENEYTALIPKPEKGETDYILDASDTGRYAVFLKNISEADAAAYVEELKKQDYSEISSDGNSVSVGVMLRQDNATLSVSYSGTIMGVMITVKDHT